MLRLKRLARLGTTARRTAVVAFVTSAVAHHDGAAVRTARRVGLGGVDRVLGRTQLGLFGLLEDLRAQISGRWADLLVVLGPLEVSPLQHGRLGGMLAVAQLPDQALGADGDQRARGEEGLDPELPQAGDARGRVVRVQGREEQVTRE